MLVGSTYVCMKFNYEEKYDLHKPDHSFTWRERYQFILISSDYFEMSVALTLRVSK